MSEITVSDLQAPDGTFQVVATLPATNYASICKTLSCNTGEVASKLLQRILIETEQREYADAMRYVGKVRGASKLAEFNAHFAPGGDLEYLTIEPPRIPPEGLPENPPTL
jgi:hypothetical protein